VGEDLTSQLFLFQIAGPRSLEVLEAASGDDLHDIRFMHHRPSSIDGMEVRVLRMGMAGTLAYEVHGKIEDARPVYDAILKAGEAFGIRRLGIHAYMMNHTEDGFPQAYYHFPYPWAEDPGFLEFLSKASGLAGIGMKLRGSIGTDIRLRYRNPVELGWAGMIKFDHDFVGRAALEKEVANPRRKMVTLVWNTEDIMDVYASQFKPGEPYPNMDAPNHYGFEVGDKTHSLSLSATRCSRTANSSVSVQAAPTATTSARCSRSPRSTRHTAPWVPKSSCCGAIPGRDKRRSGRRSPVSHT
jgi:glycine cleavage system aminomethyltransferase T